MFERIKRWYDLGLWSEKMVRDARIKGVLTEEQVETVIGEGDAE